MRFVKNIAGEMTGTVRRIWAIAVVALLAELGYAIMNIGALPIYLHADPPKGLGASATLIGFIITTFLAFETGFKAIMGLQGDRHGRKWIIIGGLVLSGVTPVIMRFLHHPLEFLPFRAIDGIGAAALWPCVFATVAIITTPEERVSAMSVFNMMYMIGLGLALPVYSFAVQVMGKPHDVFYLISAAFLLAAIFSVWTLPNTKGDVHLEGAVVEMSGVASETQHVGLKDLLKLAGRSRTLRAMLFSSILQATGINLLNGVVIIYGRDQLGIDPGDIGKVFLPAVLAIVVLAIPLGWLGGRLGKVNAVKVGIVTSMLAMFLVPMAHTMVQLSLIVLPLIIGFLMATPAWLTLVTNMAPPGRQGLIVGAVATAQGLGAMLAPTIGGFAYDRNPKAPFYAAGVLLLLALVIVFRSFHEDMKVELSEVENGKADGISP